jgi:hypothetical protein
MRLKACRITLENGLSDVEIGRLSGWTYLRLMLGRTSSYHLCLCNHTRGTCGVVSTPLRCLGIDRVIKEAMFVFEMQGNMLIPRGKTISTAPFSDTVFQLLPHPSRL